MLTESSGIKLFKNEIRFLEMLLLISTLLIVILNKMSTEVYSSNFFFVMFIVMAIAYYFIVDFGLYRNRNSFLLIAGLTAVLFSGNIALTIGISTLIASNVTIASILSIAYLAVITFLIFLILAKPVIILSIKKKSRERTLTKKK